MNSQILQNDPLAPIIFGVTLILCCALLGRFVARRFRQPTMLGEILIGVLLGNLLFYMGYDAFSILREGSSSLDIARLTLTGDTWGEAANKVLGEQASTTFLAILQGPNGYQFFQMSQATDMFFRYGVIFLMFHLGLGASVTKLRQMSADSWRVGIAGVIAPFMLGFIVLWLITPETSHIEHIFLAATLVTTSIGVVASMLEKIGEMQSSEAKTIINAAIIDDVLGLILLTIGIEIALVGTISGPVITKVSLLVCMFVITATFTAPYFLKFVSFFLRRMNELEAKLFISFIFVLVLASLANLVGVLSFIGAFAAGLLLTDSLTSQQGNRGNSDYSIKQLLAPLEVILVPVFFVLVGIQVKLELLMNWNDLFLILVLLSAALIGKMLSGFVVKRGCRRLAVGIGMMPRGEVGLVFAAIGKSTGVIDAYMFSVLVLLVVTSTLITPPLLKKAFYQNHSQ